MHIARVLRELFATPHRLIARDNGRGAERWVASMRRRDDGRWVCALCGEPLDIGDDEVEITTTFVASPGRRSDRVILAGGRELHRCNPWDTRPGGATPSTREG